MDEFDYNVFVGLSIHFGGGKPAHWSGTAGVGMSYKIQNRQNFGAQANVNAAVNFYNGGIGSLPNSNRFHFDNVLSAGVTVGTGKADPMSIYPLHLDSGTGLTDRFKYSGTIGTNMIFNNNGRNQHVGFTQLRAWDVSLQFYNDFGGFQKIGIADGYDRWWTGGGNLTIGSRKDEFQVIVGSDVFTADTNSSFRYGNDQDDESKAFVFDELEENIPRPGGMFDAETYKYTPNTAGELTQDYLNEHRNGTLFNPNAHSFGLNQGRTSFRLNTRYGQFGANYMGQSSMMSQDVIHRLINFHLIPSTQPNSWEFQYKPKLNQD